MNKIILLVLIVICIFMFVSCTKDVDINEEIIIETALEELEIEGNITASLMQVASEVDGVREYVQYILRVNVDGELKTYQVDVNFVNGEVDVVDVIREI